MNEPLRRLALHIRYELAEVQRVLCRVEEGWRRAHSSADDYYLDAVALNLRIGTVVDGARPCGEYWHQALLQQMADEIPDVRPAVISPRTHELLEPYRGFRHVARNIYTFHLDAAKLEHLVA